MHDENGRTHAITTTNGDGNLLVEAGFRPLDLGQIQRWAKVFCASGLFKDTRQLAQAVVKIQAGQELGLPPFAAMNGIDIIDGRPAPNAGLTAALVKASSGYDYRVKHSDNTSCTLEWTESGKKIGESSFTEADAKTACLLGKSNWKKYPADMYFARALTRGARRFCPDLFMGSVYTPEELGRDDGLNPFTGEAKPDQVLLEDEPPYDDLVEKLTATDAGFELCREIATAQVSESSRSRALAACMLKMADLAQDPLDVQVLRDAYGTWGGGLDGDKGEVIEACSKAAELVSEGERVPEAVTA